MSSKSTANKDGLVALTAQSAVREALEAVTDNAEGFLGSRPVRFFALVDASGYETNVFDVRVSNEGVKIREVGDGKYREIQWSRILEVATKEDELRLIEEQIDDLTLDRDFLMEQAVERREALLRHEARARDLKLIVVGQDEQPVRG